MSEKIKTTWENIGLANDFLFGKVMQNPALCKKLLERILPDLQMIDKGESYKKLNKSFVIFICLKDIFGKGRHIYTFENICKEDNTLYLKDGTTKIFLNADSQMNDVSEELNAFLNYLAGKRTDDTYVKELEKAVDEAKKNREWRHEYMTLLMRDQENQEIGEERGEKRGKEQERQKIIVKMINRGFNNEQIIELCDTSEEEIAKCREQNQ